MGEPKRIPLPLGKLPPELLAELIADPGTWSPEVRLGPAVGEDACVIALERGTLVAATDPITLTGGEVGAHAVWINANDVAVTGVRPRWFLATVLLPPGVTEPEVRALFAGMRRACTGLGAVLVGGHTEVTAAVTQPVVVGQMLGHSETGRFVPTGGLAPGDVVFQIGAAPVEAAAVLAASGRARGELPEPVLAAAARAIEDPGIVVVDAALACTALGAVALHDPTEGGLATGLREMAGASAVGLEIDGGAVAWFAPGVALCRALGLDPWGALASGCLLAGFRPAQAPSVRRELAGRGHAATPVARATAEQTLRLRGGRPFPTFARDEIARLLS